MHLQKLSLTHFKTYLNAEVAFQKKIICLAGNNGVGKTNLLDAITLTCLGKSYFQSTDKQCLQTNESFFRLDSLYRGIDGEEQVVVKYEKSKGKSIEWSGKKLDRISDLVGRIPLVVVAPDDVFDFLSGSDQRRRFLDYTICQNDRKYLDHLMQYNRLLKQRNAYLKKYDQPRSLSPELLMTISEQMSDHARIVHQTRLQFMDTFRPELEKVYTRIAGTSEPISSEYTSLLDKRDLISLHEEKLQKDLLLQRTTTGIHKDDLKVKINDRAIKTFASQGQKKSFMLALKSAQYHWLARQTGKKPIILLDDFFEKLDVDRLRAMLDLVLDLDFGQIFITDTQETRIRSLLEQVTDNFQIFLVTPGTINEI